MEWTKETAENRIAALHMEDMPLRSYTPRRAPVSPDWFVKYKKLCREFMESLTDSVETLAFMNLSQDEFMSLVMGRKMPENTSLRMRVPLAWGGELKLDNMFMCWTFPHSQNMDRFIIEQSGNQTIWLPDPAKKVYVPAHTTSGGDGGNATEDRLSQIAAQLAAGRGME